MLANTLYYSVQVQKNNSALFVCFGFATAYNALTGARTVTQRIAHAVATLQRDATSAQLAAVVAKQQKWDNAADVQCCTFAAKAEQLLLANDEAALLA
jgi:hypothetical protein